MELKGKTHCTQFLWQLFFWAGGAGGRVKSLRYLGGEPLSRAHFR